MKVLLAIILLAHLASPALAAAKQPCAPCDTTAIRASRSKLVRPMSTRGYSATSATRSTSSQRAQQRDSQRFVAAKSESHTGWYIAGMFVLGGVVGYLIGQNGGGDDPTTINVRTDVKSDD